MLAVPADVTDEASIERMVQQVIEHFGQIDVLVNNAGIGDSAAVVEMDAAHWDHVMNVNLRGPMLCCKHVGPHMIRRGRGKVINVGSVMATRVARYMSPYCASKAALVQFTRTLALEWMRHNIQVNALCPGYFLTDMNAEFFGIRTRQAVHRRAAHRPLGGVARAGRRGGLPGLRRHQLHHRHDAVRRRRPLADVIADCGMRIAE